ncbi:MAG: thioesterase [Alphaproteobacteria bacterium]|nr:thioesterase [Alphaproteobacteria bacterium]
MGQWLETNRGAVHPWEVDIFGHMNIRFYISAFSDGAWHVVNAMGMSPSYMREKRHGVATVETNLKYLRELRAGDIWHIRGGLLHLGNSSFRLVQRMYNSETGLLSATYHAIAIHFDLERRKGSPLPAEFRARAAALTVTEDGA